MLANNHEAAMTLSLATYQFGELGLQPIMKQFSPRSVEAMKRLGVFPKELVNRDVSYFEKAGENAALEILQLRWNHYEKKRLSRLKACKIERASIIKEQNFRTEFSRKSYKKLPLSPMAGTEESSAEATISIREKKTLDALQKRQQSEFQQLFANEIAKQINDATSSEKKKRAWQRELQRNAQVTSQREKWRAAKVEREKRRWKEHRKQEEDSRRKKHQSEEKAIRQLLLDELDKKKEIERNKQRAQLLEEQRSERQKKLDEKLDALHKQAMNKQEEIDQRENARQDKLKRMRKERMADAKADHERQQKRLQKILKEKYRRDEQRKKAMQRKEKEQKRRRMEFELEKSSLLERKRQIQLEKERRMRKIKEQMLDDAEEKRRTYEIKQRIIDERLKLRQRRPESAKMDLAERQRKLKRQQMNMEIKLKDEQAQKMKSSELQMEKLSRERETERLKREELKRLRKKDRLETVARMKRIQAFKLSKLTDGISKKKRQLRLLDRLKKAAQSKRIAIRGRSEGQKKILESAMAKLKKSEFEISAEELSRGVDLLSLMKKAGVRLTAEERKVIKSIPPSQNLKKKTIYTPSYRPSSAPPKRPRKKIDCVSSQYARSSKSLVERKSPQRPISASRRPRPQSARPQQRYQPKGRRANVGAIEAERRIDNIKRKLSMHMLSVLEEEQNKEEERAQILNGIPDIQEKTRMDTILGYERAKASKRIHDLQQEHSRILQEELEIHVKSI